LPSPKKRQWLPESIRPGSPHGSAHGLSRGLSAAQQVSLSFVGLIAVGMLGFRLVPGLAVGAPLGWLDALFMATSAVCVTGLSILDVSRDLSFWGQLWLLGLIQAGALGILTLAGLVLSLAGRRMGLEAEEAARGPGSALGPGAARRILRAAVLFTFAIEAVGAGLLWLLWHDAGVGAVAGAGAVGAVGAGAVGGAGGAAAAAADGAGGLFGSGTDPGPGQLVWIAVFHSVSAFCNAGFSLFSDSLVGFQTRPALLSTLAALIVVGGLGFPVIVDLQEQLQGRLRGKRPRIRLHTRLVLGATAFVLVGSTGLYLVCEWSGTLSELGLLDRLVNALFMAVTARTAGFNTVDYDALSNAGIFLTVALMWIGGAPASVAGGVKITTVALLALLLISRLRGTEHTSLAGRTVPKETVQRAAGLAAGAVFLMAALLLVLLMLEPAGLSGAPGDRLQLVRLVFELQSAFSTVGLSMGPTTAELTPGARLLMVATMLLGRLGPLVVLAAMADRLRERVDFRHAHEDVLVG